MVLGHFNMCVFSLEQKSRTGNLGMFDTSMRSSVIIVLAGILVAIALVLGLILGSMNLVPTTTTQTFTVTISGYYVTFIQHPTTCPDQPSELVYVFPWSVTLGNQTKVQPPNASITSDGGAGPWNSIYSQIVFLVPNGIYSYTLNKNLTWPS